MRRDDLLVQGASRLADDDRRLIVTFNRRPSDEELRAIEELLKYETPDCVEMKFGEQSREVLFAGHRRAIVVL